MRIILQKMDVVEHSKNKSIEKMEIDDFDISLKMVSRCEYLAYEEDGFHKILKNRFGKEGILILNETGI